MSSKLKMKKRRSTCRKLSTLSFQLSTLVAIALFFAMPLKAQVTIGPKDTSSDNFYLMKINSTADKTGGLRMPQLSADQIDGANGLTNQLLSLAPEDAAAAKGLVVFNTDTKCLQVWNSATWISLCANALPPIQITSYDPVMSYDPSNLTSFRMQGQPDRSFTVSVTAGIGTLIYDWYYTGIYHGVTTPFPNGINGSGYTDTAVLLSQNSGNSIIIHSTDPFLSGTNACGNKRGIFVKVYYKGDEAHAIYSDIWLVHYAPVCP